MEIVPQMEGINLNVASRHVVQCSYVAHVCCEDIDECAYDPPMCSQFCNNTKPGFNCSCATGYTLAEDLTHCIASHWKVDSPYLVYAMEERIVKMSIKRGSVGIPEVVHHCRGKVTAIGKTFFLLIVYFYVLHLGMRQC